MEALIQQGSLRPSTRNAVGAIFYSSAFIANLYLVHPGAMVALPALFLSDVSVGDLCFAWVAVHSDEVTGEPT